MARAGRLYEIPYSRLMKEQLKTKEKGETAHERLTFILRLFALSLS
jgi:hypothetical protein